MRSALWRAGTPLTTSPFLPPAPLFPPIMCCRWAREMSALCTVLDLDTAADLLATTLHPDSKPQCFAILYPLPPAEIWHSYPFINNVHFFADDRCAH